LFHFFFSVMSVLSSSIPVFPPRPVRPMSRGESAYQGNVSLAPRCHYCLSWCNQRPWIWNLRYTPFWQGIRCFPFPAAVCFPLGRITHMNATWERNRYPLSWRLGTNSEAWSLRCWTQFPVADKYFAALAVTPSFWQS
jgi:hypothetical protein